MYTLVMLGMLSQSPLAFLIFAIGLLLAIDVHEFSHAYLADRLGDPTPRSQGRLSLNPLVHLDLVGTLALLLIGFGWGKPVEFDPYNLKSPRRDAAIISLAGPASNLALATLITVLGRLFIPDLFFGALLVPVIYINIILAIFNFVPISPLDGEKIVFGLLPRDLAYEFHSIMSRYGLLILILLILPFFGSTPPIQTLIGPVINFILHLLLGTGA